MAKRRHDGREVCRRVGARRARLAFCLAAIAGAATPARAAPAAPAEAGASSSADVERRVLERSADEHATMSAALREKKWDAKVVARLARWARGERGGALAPDVELLREELARPVSLSVSGAVSMGSYQGGFLYYYLRSLAAAQALAARLPGAPKETPAPSSPLALVTGASSGSINAVISSIASCKKPVLDPRKSLFWQVWLPVDGAALEQSQDVLPDGLLSVKPIGDAVDRLTAAWNAHDWSDGPCAVDVGLSATRIRARSVQPLEGVNLSLPLQTEKLMFRMRGANGIEPTMTPLPPPADARAPLFDKLFRGLGPDGQPLALGAVTNVLRASSAFSFAFPPRWLALWARDGSGIDSAWFTDGGVFDDRPVGLAVEMQRWRVAAAAAAKREAPPPPRYLVQDPDVTWRPAAPMQAATAMPEPPHELFLDTWLPFLGDFINTAFEVELMDVLEREPTLYGNIEIPPRRVPVAGAYLMEFLAFAEKDFRTFDFFTGMVDAWQQLAESSLAFQVLQAAGQGPTFEHAPELDCLLAWRAYQVANAGPPPAAACAAVGVDDSDGKDALLRPNLEALVNASAVTYTWVAVDHAKDGKKQSEQQVFLGALGKAPVPYVYRQLTYRGAPADAGTVDLAIRDVMQDILERTTFDQTDGPGRFVVGSVGKALTNYYVYRPPVEYLAAGLVSDRGFEVVAGRRLPWNRHRPELLELRLDAAVRVLGIHLQSWDTQPEADRVAAFTYMGAAHLTNEFQLQRWNPALQSAVQFHVGAGWTVESLQTWNGPLLWRHGPEALVGLAAFQRLYLDVVFDYFLDDCAGNNACAHATPYLSDKLPTIVDADWGLRFSLGYRFFMD